MVMTGADITGNPELAPVNPLRAWMRDGLLHVEGLTVGATWYVYNVSGALIYQNIAASETADISLPAEGVYILQSEERTVKISVF
jgi:hypothetical protein